DRFIYNPTIGDKKLLPSPFPWFDKSPFVEYSLAFDPLRFLGYKLICIFHGKSLKEDCHQTKEERVKDDLPPLPPRPQDLNVGGPVYLTLPELNSKEAYNGYGYILTPTC
ncbi:hypothetical protein S245_067377, partial [Arachis hypogaea]